MQLPNAEQLLNQLSEQLKPLIRKNSALVGIHSGGVWLAERLGKTFPSLPIGSLDVSFYRYDFSSRGLSTENKRSHIPFDVEGMHIILIDDVFYTGRTTRAAMNEIFDYGRPAAIDLVVLVNRGGRELPIAPQLSAWETSLSVTQNLQLEQNTDGQFSLKLIHHEEPHA